VGKDSSVTEYPGSVGCDGTLAAAVFYTVLLAKHWATFDGKLSLSTMIVLLVLAAFYFAPTLVILGPIVVGILVRARRGESFLSNSCLYGPSALCIGLQYLWLGYFGSA